MKNLIHFKIGDIVYENGYYGDPFKIINITNDVIIMSSILDLDVRKVKSNDVIIAPEYIKAKK